MANRLVHAVAPIGAGILLITVVTATLVTSKSRHELNDHLIQASASYAGPEIIGALLDQGADVNTVDSMGMTPLMRVTLKGRVATMQLLIERGAHISDKNNEGHTAILIAMPENNKVKIRLLSDAAPQRQDAALDDSRL